MAEVKDPYADDYEFLVRQQSPPGFDATKMDDIDQMDDYFRAVGILPPRPPADVVPTPGYNYNAAAAPLWGGGVDYDTKLPATCHLYAHVPQFGAAPLWGAVDYDTKRLATCDLYAHVPLFGAAPLAPAIDVSFRAMEKDAGERPAPDYLDTTQGGQMDPTAQAALVQCEQYSIDDTATVHRAVSEQYGTDASHHQQAAQVLSYQEQEVLDMERAQVAAFGHMLGGPTAD